MTGSVPIVVVTRPAPDDEALAAAVAKRELRTIRNPAFRLQPVPEPQRRARVAALGDCEVVIVTSPFAARLTVVSAPTAGRTAPRWLAPGRGTAAILSAAGLDATHPAQGGTSEDLLAMPALTECRGKRVGIVGAPGGRRLLDRELARRGASVRRIDLYRRQPLPITGALSDALAKRSPLIVLISSGNALELITDALSEAQRREWLRQRFVVSSPRLAEIVRARGAERVHVADGASDDAMLGALDAVA